MCNHIMNKKINRLVETRVTKPMVIPNKKKGKKKTKKTKTK